MEGLDASFPAHVSKQALQYRVTYKLHLLNTDVSVNAECVALVPLTASAEFLLLQPLCVNCLVRCKVVCHLESVHAAEMLQCGHAHSGDVVGPSLSPPGAALRLWHERALHQSTLGCEQTSWL